MVWARLDDAILDNPKVARVGALGFAIHVAAITYCCRNLTDGFIPFGKVRTLFDLSELNYDEANPLALSGSGRSMTGNTGLDAVVIADKLVEAELWEEVVGGFQIHDFLDYNPSRAQVEADRAAKSAAGKAGASRRWQPPKLTDGGSEARAKADAMAPAMAPALAERWQNDAPGPVPGPVPSCQEPNNKTGEVVLSGGVVGGSAPDGASTAPLETDIWIAKIEARIRVHPIFGHIDALRRAKEHVGRMMACPQKLEWVLRAIDEAAEKSSSDDKPHIILGRLVDFMKAAKAPKSGTLRAAEPTTGMKYAEFKRDNIKPIDAAQQGELAAKIAGIGRGAA